MTSINYPSSVLPLPLISNARHVEEKRLSRTVMDNRYAIVRKRFTKVPVNFDFQLILDQSDLSYFQDWFVTDLDYGLNFFNMDMPVGASLLSSHEIRFLQNPNYTWNGNLCTVNAKCEGTELNLGIYYDSVMIGLIESIGGVRGFDTTTLYFDKIDKAINITYYDAVQGL
jgi:hypothetical protein